MSISTDTTLIKRREKTRFPGLKAAAFQHEWDRQATSHLGTLPGLDWISARLIEYGIERSAYVINISSNLRVGPRQLPSVYRMLQESCAILDMPEPELYLEEGGIGAYTSGHDRPFVVLHTGLVDLLEPDELMAVIAHELGHIKCGHVLYRTMALQLRAILSFVPGAAKFTTHGLEAAFLNWYRRSELSADRAALLVLQDAAPVMTMLMKLAGGTRKWAHEMNLEAFLEQAQTYNEAANNSLVDRAYGWIIGSKTTHPFAVERAKLLGEWAQSDAYKRMLAGYFTDAPPKPAPSETPQERVKKGWGNVKERAFDATQGFIDNHRGAKPDEKS